MPAYSKRDKRLPLSNRGAVRRSNGLFETGAIQTIEPTRTGKRVWVLFDDHTTQEKLEREMVDEDCSDLGNIGLTMGDTVFVTYRGREVIASVVRNSPSSSNVDLSLQDYPQTTITVDKHDIRLLPNRRPLQLMEQEANFVVGDEEPNDPWKPFPLVIDIPNGKNSSTQNYEDAEEKMAAAVLTSLSLSPVLSKFEAPNSDLDTWESSVFDNDQTMYVTRPPDDEERQSVYGTKTRRQKNPLKTMFQCTWPRCGKILWNSAGIIRHVRKTHLGPKNKDDDGFSDGEEEFYFNEIEVTADDIARHSSEGSISPPPLRSNPRRCRSMSDPSRPTQPLVSSTSKQLHFDDNFTWPLRSTGGSRSKTKGALHQTVHTNSRKGRGDGRKCRKVYGMENKHLWCTQCRWKKACIKFVD